MNKRMFVVACTLGVLTLTACGGGKDGGDSANGEVTLKLVAADYGDTASNSSTAYWNDVARRFTAANPKIKVDVQVINWNDIDSQVKTMIQSGNMPDVLQTGGYADKVADDLLYKADEVLSETTRKNLIDSFAKAGEVDGTQYGIPFVSSARAFFYNKDLFAQAGITEAPQSWDELKAAAQKIKAKVPGVTPYALPLGPEEAQGESLIWELGSGGGYTDAKGGYTLDAKANVEAFSWLKANLVGPGLTYANPATTDRKTAFADFAAGKTAMLNGHPTLIQMSKDGKVDYGVAPIPGTSGPLTSTLGVADWMMAFKDGGHKEEVRTFLDFAYSKENTLKFDETYNLMPVTEDTLEEMTANGKHKDLEPFHPAAARRLLSARRHHLGRRLRRDQEERRHRRELPAKVLGELQKKAEAAVADQ